MSGEGNSLKRKRDSKDEGDDPALKEYLSVVAPSRKSKLWADGGIDANGSLPSNTSNKAEDNGHNPVAQPHNDTQIQNKKQTTEKTKSSDPQSTEKQEQTPSNDTTVPNQSDSTSPAGPEAEQAPQSDADWLRSRTSRLLGLLDEDEEEEAAASKPPNREANPSDDDSADREEPEPEPSSTHNDDNVPQSEDPPDANIDTIRTSGRLFVRNLPYNAAESDLQPLFLPFGKTDEVCFPFMRFSSHHLS